MRIDEQLLCNLPGCHLCFRPEGIEVKLPDGRLLHIHNIAEAQTIAQPLPDGYGLAIFDMQRNFYRHVFVLKPKLIDKGFVALFILVDQLPGKALCQLFRIAGVDLDRKEALLLDIGKDAPVAQTPDERVLNGCSLGIRYLEPDAQIDILVGVHAFTSM